MASVVGGEEDDEKERKIEYFIYLYIIMISKILTVNPTTKIMLYNSILNFSIY